TPTPVPVIDPSSDSPATLMEGYLILNDSISDVVHFFNIGGAGFAQLFSAPFLPVIPPTALTVTVTDDSLCSGPPGLLFCGVSSFDVGDSVQYRAMPGSRRPSILYVIVPEGSTFLLCFAGVCYLALRQRPTRWTQQSLPSSLGAVLVLLGSLPLEHEVIKNVSTRLNSAKARFSARSAWTRAKLPSGKGCA